MRLLVLLLMLAAVGCALVKPKATPLNCLWPDPIVFTLNDDSWRVCFQIEHPDFSPTLRCTTVAKLRSLSIPDFAH